MDDPMLTATIETKLRCRVCRYPVRLGKDGKLHDCAVHGPDARERVQICAICHTVGKPVRNIQGRGVCELCYQSHVRFFLSAGYAMKQETNR